MGISMRLSHRCLIKRDFDAWAYNIYWPQKKAFLPLMGFASLTVEDIKFAYNAWCLLRLAMFYGAAHPKVLSPLVNCTPSMDIIHGGNRIFYMHSQVSTPLSQRKIKVALTPCHPGAQLLQSFPWETAAQQGGWGSTESDDNCGVEIILGMENGMSEEVRAGCDYCLYVPQYGSVGSLSMLSAMAIAVHLAFCARWMRRGTEVNERLVPFLGHMPLSSDANGTIAPCTLPHEKNLIHFSNEEIRALLAERRLQYRMQLSVMVYNEFGDRNIGAIMRNANVFNCEELIVLNRRKFNRRGAVGTHHVLTTTFHATLNDRSCQSRLQGYVLWLLHQYYPYLKVYGASPSNDNDNDIDVATFLRHDNIHLQRWLRCNGYQHNEAGPIANITASFGTGDHWVHLIGKEVYLDDESSLVSAVKSAAAAGYRGIMLVVPEEGATLPLELVKESQRVVFIAHPNRLARDVQRGLNGALATAVALERLRTAIDNI